MKLDRLKNVYELVQLRLKFRCVFPGIQLLLGQYAQFSGDSKLRKFEKKKSQVVGETSSFTWCNLCLWHLKLLL